MLFKIAKKNVKNNFENYLIYFISIVFNVIIYFTFEGIRFNKQVESFVGSDPKMLMVFKGASIIIAIFSAIFILYSSSFFIKKRKKEIGLYSLLGLKKKEIGSMLFYENIIMGIFALVIGILLGGLLCKLFIMILAKFIGINVAIKFSVSLKAVLNTIIAFGVLFLIVSINAYTIIYRFKLIDLFKAENKGEKQSQPSIILAILAIVALGIEIAAVIGIHDSPTFMLNIPIILVCSIVGTFIFFRTFLIFIINGLKNKKSLYYKGDNIISISHVLYRIKSNGRNLAIIALLNAVTLTSMGYGYAFYYSFQKIDKMSTPFSYCYISNDKSLDKKVENLIGKYKENKLILSKEVELVKVNGQILNFAGNNKDAIALISQSKFEEIAKIRGIKDTLKLSSTSEAIVLKYGSEEFDGVKGKTTNIFYGNLKDAFKIINRKEYDVMNDVFPGITLLVKDEIYNKYYNKENVLRLKGYIVENQRDSKALSKDIIRIMPSEVKLSYEYENVSILIFISMLFFIGVLLGLIFLLSTGSIIYFKQLTEANDDKKRYEILKKIGITKDEIKRSIQKQVFTSFASPLALGILHSTLAFVLLNRVIIRSGMLVPMAITLTSYSCIYAIYYFLTVKSYMKIVNCR